MPATSRPQAVFNPPPGWPPAPAGWAPPAGWQPDPSWPAAPKGHRFWINPETGKPALGPAGSYGAPSARRRAAGCGCLTIVGLLVMGSCLGAVAGGDDPTTPTPNTSSSTSPSGHATTAPAASPVTMTTTITPTVTATPTPAVTASTVAPEPKPTKTPATPRTPAPSRTTAPAPVPLKAPAHTQAPSPVPAPEPQGDAGTVHGGSYCSDEGATGISDRGGRTLVCKVAKDGELRWKRP